MDRCLNRRFSPQAALAAIALLLKRSQWVAFPTSQMNDSIQAASKLADGTVCSPPPQAPTVAATLAPNSSAAQVQPIDRYVPEQLNDPTQAASIFLTVLHTIHHSNHQLLLQLELRIDVQLQCSQWIVVLARQLNDPTQAAAMLAAVLHTAYHNKHQLLL